MTKEDVGGVCVCIMDYYSIKRMKETLLFATTEMDLECIIVQ